jgi:hypothetical protein
MPNKSDYSHDLPGGGKELENIAASATPPQIEPEFSIYTNTP